MTVAASVRRMIVATVTVLASCLTLVGVTAPATQAAASGDWIRAMDPDDYEHGVHVWINRTRAERGLPRLRAHRCTDYYAERWSRKLGRALAFYHQDLDPFFSKCHARYAGETLARGHVSPRQMVRLWMNSPGHRAILLSKNPRRIGIGAYLDSRGDWLVAADFTRF